MKIWIQLWRDRRGEASMLSVILLTSILAIGAVVGLTTFRDQVVQEFGDLAVSLENLDQSYSGPNGVYNDVMDPTMVDPPNAAPACLIFSP